MCKMSGLMLFFTLILVIVHWSLVIPYMILHKDEGNRSWNEKYKGLPIDMSKIFGTALCIIPPAYILVIAIFYLNSKGTEFINRRFKKENEDV